MANQIPLTNILDPSAVADQIQLDRRMRMAEMLRQQAMAPEQQQTAGGYVLPYSPLQGLSKLAAAYGASKMDEQTDAQRVAMAQRQSQMLMNALRGNQPQSVPDTRFQGMTGMGFDEKGNVTQTPQDFNNQFQEAISHPAPQQPVQQNGGQFDLGNLIRGNAISQLGGEQAGGAFWKQYEPTDATKLALAAGVDPRLANRAELQKATMYQMQPGAMTQNLLTGQNMFAPKVGEGIGLTPQGTAYSVPGYAQANANIQGAQAGAIEGAKAGWNPQTYQLPQGPTVLTQAQAARMAQGKGGAPGLQLQGQGAAKTESIIGEGLGKRFNDIQDAGFAANGKIVKAQQLNSLLEGLNTGKLATAGNELAAWGKSMGLPISDKLDNAQAAKAVANSVALELRNPSGGAGMPGAMSNSDRDYLQSMVAGMDKTPGANKLLIDGMVKLAQRDQEVAQLARDYKQRTGGFDEGFYNELKQYADTHPLFQKPLAGSDLHARADAILRGNQ